MRRRCPPLVFLLFLLLAGHLNAQAPDTSMRAFYRSLAGLTPAELGAWHVPPTDPVRNAFVLLELQRRGGDPALAAEAARAFAVVVKTTPTNPWGHLGLGITLRRARKTMVVVRSVGAADGEASLVAKREIQKAFDLNPEFWSSNEIMVAAFGQSAQKARADSIATVLASAPRTSSDFLRRARAEFARHDDSAAGMMYWQGVDAWDNAGAADYVSDVAIIATPEEIISLTDGTLTKRATALHQFWKKRAVRGGIAIGERIGVHYRRIETARQRYAMQKGTCRIGTNIFGARRTGIESELDDRGAVFVRYGTPTELLTPPFGYDRKCAGTEIWGYRDPDGRFRVYYFASGRIEADALRTFDTVDADAEMAEFLSGLKGFDGRYAFIAARAMTIHTYEFMKRIQEPLDQALTDVRIAQRSAEAAKQNDRITYDNRKAAFDAFTADAAAPFFDRPLPFFFDVATFRGHGCTDVVYSVAAAAPSYHLNVEVVDTFSWDGQGVDAGVRKDETPVGGLLRATGVLCTAPDHNAYARFTISTDSSAGGTTGGELNVPDYSGSSLMISGLLFATRAPGPFVRGNAHLAIVPPRQFRVGEGFRLFYELYNLPRGHAYRTDITFSTTRPSRIARLLKRKNKTTVTFSDVAATDDVVQESRTLVPDVSPGNASVTITVTDLITGESATSSKTMWILPPIVTKTK